MLRANISANNLAHRNTDQHNGYSLRNKKRVSYHGLCTEGKTYFDYRNDRQCRNRTVCVAWNNNRKRAITELKESDNDKENMPPAPHIIDSHSEALIEGISSEIREDNTSLVRQPARKKRKNNNWRNKTKGVNKSWQRKQQEKVQAKFDRYKAYYESVRVSVK